MDVEILKNELRNFISLGLEKGILEFERRLSPSSLSYRDFIHQKRRYIDINKEFQKGIVSSEERNREFDKISNALLHIIDDLSEDGLIETSSIKNELMVLNIQVEKLIKIMSANSDRIYGIEERLKRMDKADLSKVRMIKESMDSNSSDLEILTLQLGGVLTELQNLSRKSSILNPEILEQQLGGILTELQYLNSKK